MSTHLELLSPVSLGSLALKNRLVMAPLTRMRAIDGDVPSPLAKTYYSQRASAGMIITEATQISPLGKGYPATPGIYSEGANAGLERDCCSSPRQRRFDCFATLACWPHFPFLIARKRRLACRPFGNSTCR